MEKNTHMRKIVCWILVVCWMAVIFSFSARTATLSAQDSATVGMWLGKVFVPGFSGWDEQEQKEFADKIDHPVRKAAHASEYAVLGFLLAGGLADDTKKRLYCIGFPWIVGTLYAASDELHQMFVPGRSCQVTDIMIDSSGVFLGVLVGQLIWVYRIWARRKKN